MNENKYPKETISPQKRRKKSKRSTDIGKLKIHTNLIYFNAKTLIIRSNVSGISILVKKESLIHLKDKNIELMRVNGLINIGLIISKKMENFINIRQN